MCGIYGFIGQIENKVILSKALCVLNAERGNDSAGIATVSEESVKCRIHKKAVSPAEFSLRETFASRAESARILMGHTRWPTTGKVVDRNAHPFRRGQTVMTHNGFITNEQEVARYVGKPYEVDSQLLCEMLETYGHIESAEGKLNLAYWQENRPDQLKLVRYGNPLSYSITADGKGLIYSSLSNHLVAAMGIAGLECSNVTELGDCDGLTVTDNGREIILEQRPDAWEIFGDHYEPISKTTYDGGYYYSEQEEKIADPYYWEDESNFSDWK